MGDKIIEPSEIIIDGQGLPKEPVTHVNPQIRFLARFFDYAIFLLILLCIKLLLKSSFPSNLFNFLVPFEFFIWIPIEAILLSTWGTTPGKFFLKTDLRQGRKRRLSFSTAMKRSFNVWFRGLGMGIPGINVICMLVASSHLKVLGSTSWDREDNIVVSHRAVSQLRITIAAIFLVISFFLYYGNKHQGTRKG